MEKSKWLERYKDPRWQKKRLEILERDEWECQDCGTKDKTLNIHHRWYEKDNAPWEYEDKCFLTLCDECHEHEHYMIECVLSNPRMDFFSAGFDWMSIESFFSLIRDEKYAKLTMGAISILMDKKIEEYALKRKALVDEQRL